eukprot:CAMPEP_0184496978 /NCGR_PEP_ID=MMETSP0113_2-20130426/35393_1 /TAXON_ID=91329 /ORGANISM="Norrisiella sphaerica, Strain BC52" /LENGTH=52 /DNA_ID=CAMNT_0026883877 /DNA_START=91 /DNA_END=245 /DNA_ORIENTATION=-
MKGLEKWIARDKESRNSSVPNESALTRILEVISNEGDYPRAKSWMSSMEKHG